MTFPPPLSTSMCFQRNGALRIWIWTPIPVHQETKHLLKFLRSVFTLTKCMDRWHINSPAGLPILSRTIFLIRQTYLTQKCVYSPFSIFFFFISMHCESPGVVPKWPGWGWRRGGAGVQWRPQDVKEWAQSRLGSQPLCEGPIFSSCILSFYSLPKEKTWLRHFGVFRMTHPSWLAFTSRGSWALLCPTCGCLLRYYILLLGLAHLGWSAMLFLPP